MKKSAGILLYKTDGKALKVMLVHPGGPFFVKKDAGVWSIPKGEFEENEDPLAAAKREFFEEIGSPVTGEFIPLGEVKQKGGKTVYCWAVEGELNTSKITGNTFKMPWPPSSGKLQEFPEVDKVEWFTLAAAIEKINPAQVLLLERLQQHLHI
ncbi:MAG: NUDIX domain-containing protein [Chitinophagales bacterium]